MRKIPVAAVAAAVATALLSAPALSTAQEGSPPPDSAFQKVVLNDSPGEPMDLAVLPNGRVLHTTRPGEVWLHHPGDGRNTLAATLDVYQHDEEGLQSIAVDPGFNGTTNRWVYLYYSPPMNTPSDDPSTPDVNEGDAPTTGTPAEFEKFEGALRLSRFQLKGDKIDLSTEQQIIDVPVDRGICCHVGGDITFDGDGNLYLSTGDDTDPFSSDGYAPLDEREQRNPAFDAQRSAANTNDLRGKILRIKVGKGGSYTIPDGNLFPPGTENARPEIYLMGLRNPFRIEVDPTTNALFVADYSPDATKADPARGPAGHGKWFVATEAGNYGWPYCATAKLPYVDYDFATQQSGEAFDCAAPVNESPHNTGLTELPPVEQPDVWYSYGQSENFPELGTGGIGPMAGPAYDYDPNAGRTRTPVAWPRYYDGIPLFYEWTRDYIKGFRLDDSGALAGIESVLPSLPLSSPMDMEFGRDGALYVLDYGKGFFSENPEAALSRIDYIGPNGNHSPVANASADVDNGHAPLRVSFSSDGTKDADGDRLIYEWDFDSDGDVDSREKNPAHTYTENGAYIATLQVTDTGGAETGRTGVDHVEIVVGNKAPVVRFVTPVDGQQFAFGDTVQYEVSVTDDQPVDCSRVQVTYILGHNQHGHPQTTATGCAGSIKTTQPEGHDPGTDELSGVFNATYTDPGADGLPSLSGSHQVVLTPTG